MDLNQENLLQNTAHAGKQNVQPFMAAWTAQHKYKGSCCFYLKEVISRRFLKKPAFAQEHACEEVLRRDATTNWLRRVIMNGE